MTTAPHPTPAQVALIGLGSIGGGMAGRLAVSDRVDLTVFNRSPKRYAGLPGRGVAVAADLASAVTGAEVVLLSLTDDAAVRGVVDAVRDHLRPGAVVVDTSTIGSGTAVALAAELAGRDVGFVDSPVTGGAEAARLGTLTLLCGGETEVVERVRPVLELVSARIVHVGGPGQGQVAKAVNQVMLAGALLGVAEGVALARSCGLDAHALVDALQDGAASSWVLRERAHHMIDGDFAPRGRIGLHLKDLRIALELAADRGLGLPLGSLVAAVEADLVEQGWGDADVAVIVKAAESA